MIIKPSYLTLLLLLLSFGFADDPELSDVRKNKANLNSEIENYLEGWAANKKFNGNVLIAKGDSILYQNSFGYANRSFQVKNSDSTIFLIGSLTKPFTAFSILLLEKEGKLSLDDKLEKFFPDFPKSNLVTIRQLLTHKSGITDYHAFPEWEEMGKIEVTPESTIKMVKSRPYSFEPGEKFRYSNTGYILLGMIIEKASGSSFAHYLNEAIIEPLGLKNTGVIDNVKIINNLAEGYSSDLRESKKAEFIHYGQPFSSGNMYSTALDLWTFTKSIMNSDLLDALKTEEIFNISKYYGYGWGIRDYNGIKAYGHHGGMNGYSASMTYIPVGEYFICFTTNDDNTPKFTITNDLVSLIFGGKVQPPKYESLMPLTKEMIYRVTGNYVIKPGDTLKVFEQGSKLFVQETGQAKHEMFPIGENEFSFKLLEFNYVFSNIIEGKADTLEFIGILNFSVPRIKE